MKLKSASPIPPQAGGHKEMSSILADQWRPRICALMRAGGGLLMFLLSLLLPTRLLPMFYSTLVVSSCCCELCWLLYCCCFTTYASIPALVGVNGVLSLLYVGGPVAFSFIPACACVLMLLRSCYCSPLLLLVAGVTATACFTASRCS
jgi:hypothetical protein